MNKNSSSHTTTTTTTTTNNNININNNNNSNSNNSGGGSAAATLFEQLPNHRHRNLKVFRLPSLPWNARSSSPPFCKHAAQNCWQDKYWVPIGIIT